MVSGQPPVLERGGAHCPAVPPLRLVSRSGQVQPVRGTDPPCPHPPCPSIPGFSGGGSLRGQFFGSDPLKARHNRRIHSHNVFKPYAARGKSPAGWFYGFALHLATNDRRELRSFRLAPGNGGDRNADGIDRLRRKLKGKRFGDRRYISRKLFERLYERGVRPAEHSRRRSPVNFLVNVLAALSAYSFPPHKPSIRGFHDERSLPFLV
ncbi:MAG: transposase [Treponema sp.]|jgi:hypothetical protein|nr:transposase [Treponema sp.]